METDATKSVEEKEKNKKEEKKERRRNGYLATRVTGGKINEATRATEGKYFRPVRRSTIYFKFRKDNKSRNYRSLNPSADSSAIISRPPLPLSPFSPRVLAFTREDAIKTVPERIHILFVPVSLARGVHTRVFANGQPSEHVPG